MALQIVQVKAIKAYEDNKLAGLTVKVRNGVPFTRLKLELVKIDQPSYRSHQEHHAFTVGEAFVHNDRTAVFEIPPADNSIVRRLNLTIGDDLGVRVTCVVEGRRSVEAVRPTLYSPLGNFIWKLFNPKWKTFGYYDPHLYQARVTVG